MTTDYYRPTQSLLAGHESKILHAHGQGASIASLATKYGTSWRTMRNFLRDRGQLGQKQETRKDWIR